MATLYYKRLAEKYGTKNITGGKYQTLIRDVLQNNNTKINNAIGRLTNDKYKQDLKRWPKDRAKAIKLPSLETVLPKRSVSLVKSADQGNLITDTLRRDLERKLRGTLKKYDQGGKPRMEIQRGTGTGKIRPELIEEFQKGVKETMDGRTKKNSKYNSPGHVRNIAVTEIRSNIDMIKENYIIEVERKNPQLQITKTWLHNKQLSKKPRESHIAMHKITIGKNELFEVGRDDESGVDYMNRPHDPTAPAKQVIGCSCDIVYKARLRE